MNTLLKIYIFSSKFAADDIILYDMIIGISDLINYHGSSVEEIKASFIDVLGNHLRLREEIGEAPDTHSV